MYIYYIHDVLRIMISKADNLQHYIDVPKNTTMFTCKDCIMLWFLNKFWFKKKKKIKNQNSELELQNRKISAQIGMVGRYDII